MQSESINELAAALSRAQGEFTSIPKGELNPFFKSNYAGLPDVVRVAAPVLSGNGLAISQFITQNELGEDCLKTYLLHSSGQFIEHSMKLYLGKLDSQGMGSATTYARRYSYMSVLGLVADEDDDGNKASNGGSQQRGTDSGSQQRTADDPRIATIIEASKVSDDGFINSLAEQWAERGSLSDKQIESGFKKACSIVSPVKVSTPRVDEEPF